MHRNRTCRLLGAIALAFGALAVVPATGDAQGPTNAPLRILVGFTAGGTTDEAARLLGGRLKDLLGRPVVVENRPGASGRIAASALKHAAPDGSTIMLAPMVVTVLAPMVWSQLDYDPERDFAPIAHVSNYAIALAVNKDVPAGDLAEFVAWAKRSPTGVSYGVSAAGSLPHLFGVTLAQTTGLSWVAVPYRGLAPLQSDLLGGQITAGLDALSNLMELHRGGRIRIIATSGSRRSALLPGVPTFREQGFATLEGTGWIAMHAPAGTPKATIDALSVAIGESLRSPQVRAQMIRLGYEPTGTTAQELAAIAARDAARWRPIIKATGFNAD